MSYYQPWPPTVVQTPRWVGSAGHDWPQASGYRVIARPRGVALQIVGNGSYRARSRRSAGPRPRGGSRSAQHEASAPGAGPVPDHRRRPDAAAAVAGVHRGDGLRLRAAGPGAALRPARPRRALAGLRPHLRGPAQRPATPSRRPEADRGRARHRRGAGRIPCHRAADQWALQRRLPRCAAARGRARRRRWRMPPAGPAR